MAHFYGTIQGHRGEASRLGIKSSGLSAKVNGWHLGCKVTINHNHGEDWVDIYLTSGSTGSQSVHLGSYNVKDLERLSGNVRSILTE